MVGESLQGGGWIPEREFEEKEESIYKKEGWRIRIPGPIEVAAWSLRAMGVLGPRTYGTTEGRIVILENLEAISKEMLQRIDKMPKGRIERIFSRDEFVMLTKGVLGAEEGLSDLDVELLLNFLRRDKRVLSLDRASGTIKFKAPGEKIPSPITQEDITIASLKSLIKVLETETTALTTRIEELSNSAKESVVRKNRTAALATLRSKKLAETTLEKRHTVLAQLEGVFASIEQAVDQIDLVKIMEASGRVLSGLNKEVGGVEKVDEVVDQLREQMGVVDETGKIISEIGQAGAVDEAEVDDELEVLEAEETRKKEKIERRQREEKEKEEAEETRKRLQGLEEVESRVKAEKEAEVARERKAVEDKSIEDMLTKSTEDMNKLSLQQEKAKLPAS